MSDKEYGSESFLRICEMDLKRITGKLYHAAERRVDTDWTLRLGEEFLEQGRGPTIILNGGYDVFKAGYIVSENFLRVKFALLLLQEPAQRVIIDVRSGSRHEGPVEYSYHIWRIYKNNQPTDIKQ